MFLKPCLCRGNALHRGFLLNAFFLKTPRKGVWNHGNRTLFARLPSSRFLEKSAPTIVLRKWGGSGSLGQSRRKTHPGRVSWQISCVGANGRGGDPRGQIWQPWAKNWLFRNFGISCKFVQVRASSCKFARVRASSCKFVHPFSCEFEMVTFLLKCVKKCPFEIHRKSSCKFVQLPFRHFSAKTLPFPHFSLKMLS